MAVEAMSLVRPREVSPQTTPGTYFFGPLIDFLLLGGASLFLLPIAILLPSGAENTVAWVVFFLALVINHPHFAHSYQLFYEGFSTKSGSGVSRSLRMRYLAAGVLVPAVLTAFYVGTVALGELRVLGAAGNLMAFFVGWHYVKQGYGMLIVDSVLKRQYFKGHEKRALVLNAYAVWLLTWISFNTYASERSLFGIEYVFFQVPDIAFAVSLGAAVLTGVWVASMLFTRWRSAGSLPINGLTAYAVTLYLWMVFVRIDPIWLLVVPALHSLQYLVVVYRYQINRRNAAALEGGRPVRLRRFMIFGFLLGMLGFYLMPAGVQAALPASASITDASVAFFIFWVFINVHHYFIDNVMWRSENSDVGRFLFNRTP